jgi:hypothetical protein
MRQSLLIARNTEIHLRYKIIGGHKKTSGRVPYLGLELTIHVIKSSVHLVRQSL